MTRNTLSLSLVLSTLLLSACASSGAKAPTGKISDGNVNSARPALESKSIDKAMRTALARAEASGNQQEIIATLQQIQSRNPDDAIIATRYARALREDDQINKAQRVLRPFVTGDKPNVEALTEMAMAQLALGDYASAKRYSQEATGIDGKNARGYLALGTAQDALKDHANAEQSFRQGLKYWKGDPSPILNNLALNLASQGHLEESLSLLERAVKISPKRMELERNRRIIATLLETSDGLAPAPNKKPDILIPESAKPRPPASAVEVKPTTATPPQAVQAAPKAATVQKSAPNSAMTTKTNIKLKSSVNE